MAELAAWLEQFDLGQHARVLLENDVDLATLPHLSDNDLKELGLSLGHRRKLLAAISAAPPTTHATSQKLEAERRQLTVMFCDLAGSTELSERLDPEEFRNLLGRYHDAVAGAVAAHDGHVAKLLGDGVLAFFGWPRAHEDDAERAVRAALTAVEAVARLDSGGVRLAARAGIATGQVVVGDRTGTVAEEQSAVAGATPNLAARLQAEAQPGSVVIHNTTQRLIGGTFELEECGAIALKGFAKPVDIWRVVGVARTSSRFEAKHGNGLTAFVGRTSEIALMHDRWRLARAGEGQAVVLSGEAGIGKSRILREFTGSLDGERCRTLRIQCSPHEVNSAFQPLIAEIGVAAGFRPEDATETRLDRLQEHLSAAFPDGPPGDVAPLFAGLLGLPSDRYPPVDMAPQRRKQRIVTVLSERIIGLADDFPILLLVEDIHWVDPSTLDVLDAIVERIQSRPVLSIMTCRPEFQPHWGGFGHVTVHSLNRLGRSDGRAIAGRISGGKMLPDEVLDRIISQTDGVPLFVEELTKTVLEAGFLEEQVDRYILTGPLPTLAIPATLQDSLMARLDRLSSVKQVVQAAACIGREFNVGLLGAVLSMTTDNLDDALTQLLDAELIFRHDGNSDEPHYIFKHALVQDAAYSSLLTTTRHGLHERLALALERAESPDALELARHFHAAGLNARAAGLYLQVGRRLLEASAFPEAIGALESGLQSAGALPLSTDRDRLELDIRVALGTARMANFGWAHPSVSEAMESAFPLAKHFADEDALCSILWALWVHYQTRTNFPRAHEWLAELEAVAAEWAKSDLPLVYEMSAGCQYFWQADYDRALGHTDRLRSIYEPAKHSRISSLTNHDPLVFSQHWAGSLADWIAGRPDRAVERLDEAVTLAREIGHPFNLVFALTAGATALIYLGQPDRLLAYCDEAALIATEEALGPFSEHVNVMQWRGGAHVIHGDFKRGYTLAKRGNDFWTASGGSVCTAMFRSWIVLGLGGLGRNSEATLLNAANIAHCRETGDQFMEPECLRLRGEMALEADAPNFAQAERDFREALAISNEHGAHSWALRAAMSLARLLLFRDRRDEAVASLEPVFKRFTEGFESEDLKQAKTLLVSLD